MHADTFGVFVLSLATPLSPAPASLDGAGPVLSAVAAAEGVSRAVLGEATGLSRMTLGARLGALVAAGLVQEDAATVPSGGRPTRLLRLRPEGGAILAADVGETHLRLAVADLSPAILAEESIAYRVADGPEAVLGIVAAGFERLLAGLHVRPFVAGAGLSLPAPVDHRLGRIYGPSVLTGWDDFPVGDWLGQRLGSPVAVENDVNLMTIFEHRRLPDRPAEFLFVKLGTGIGSGLVAGGHLQRGARGAAGDIGHMQFIREGAPLCRCGKVGCLEARAAGWALARELSAAGLEARDARDVMRLFEAGEPEARRLVEAAGEAVGEALGHVVAVLNPARIVVGGTLSGAGEPLMAGLSALVRERCLPLATADLVIEASTPVEEGTLLGAAHALRERVFGAEGVDLLLSRYRDWLARAA